MMTPFIILLIFSVAVEARSLGYADVFKQNCQNSSHDTELCIRQYSDPNKSEEVFSIFSDINLFQLPYPLGLTEDCPNLDSKNLKSTYECGRNVIVKCLPPEWHGYILPVQNVLDYRKYRCDNENILSSCKTEDHNELTCQPTHKTLISVSEASSDPDTSIGAFSRLSSWARDCFPTMYVNCSSEAQAVIKKMNDKLKLPACGSAPSITTSWLLVLSVTAVALILHWETLN